MFEPHQDLVKKIKLAEVVLHFYFQEKNTDYLIILTKKCELVLYKFTHGHFDVVSKYIIYVTDPLLFAMGINGDVYLLHSGGVCIWTLTQIDSKCQPQRIKISFVSPPINLFPINNSSFAVVCSKNIVSIVNSELDTLDHISYHQELAMDLLLYDYTVDLDTHSHLLIPSNNRSYPYLFNRQEILQWKKLQYFQQYISFCKDYYISDEVLPNKEGMMCFSAKEALVYILLTEEMIVLQGRRVGDQQMTVFGRRLRIKTKWSSSQLSCTLNHRNGRIAYIGKERIGQLLPFQYRTIRKSIKQKSDSEINHAYYLNNNLMLLVSHHSSEKPSKLYLHQCDEQE